jgi:outer membrane protein assembly factor BamA
LRPLKNSIPMKIKNLIYRYLPLILPFLFMVVRPVQLPGQESQKPSGPAPGDSIRIDSIAISRNWMTWDRIIKNELLFGAGEWVRYGEIDTSMNKVWNIGNFADVSYTINETPDGNILEIEALDALQIYPVITIDHSSENDYNYRLGIGDENFLGSNSELKIVWDKKPTGATWDFRFKMPRQLMFMNMTAEVGTKVGLDTRVFYDRVITEVDGKKEAEYQTRMIAPYHKLDVYANIGNPWHLDYRYRFSPDLSLRYMQDAYDSTLLSQEELELGVHPEDATYRFFNIAVSENIGTVDKQRHRKNGYTAGLSFDYFIGLQGTRSHYALNFNGEFHRTLTPVIQLSTWLRTGVTNADDQYRFIKGSSDVLGLRWGEIYGKKYYSAYAGIHFTWLNSKWLSLENAYFLNWGNGADTYADLFRSKQKFSVGTSLEIRIPVVSWINFRFTFMYAGPGTEWFKFNM